MAGTVGFPVHGREGSDIAKRSDRFCFLLCKMSPAAVLDDLDASACAISTILSISAA
jgi:hypothetical protein